MAKHAPMMAIAKRLKSGGSFDLTGWELETIDQISSALNEAILFSAKEVLDIASREYDAYCWFAVEYEDETGDGVRPADRPTDPTTLFIRLPFGEDEYNGPIWSFSIMENIAPIIDCFIEDGSFEADLNKIREALSQIVSRIDSALAERNALSKIES